MTGVQSTIGEYKDVLYYGAYIELNKVKHRLLHESACLQSNLGYPFSIAQDRSTL
ncbi:hypothetical protein [Vulcanisaeta souniana]|uniref:Uncharacterized protein n=1 Tax=Vulcanisaeta souniana JCM 11219 TaxID=1293586 RepID=A0ABM8BM99_9CREN|nr:hypothetical protein [Vulcanisaeta souniana]BDR92040.1 hypothetical protein Vsou_11330 [Vulcanisaeta souniana JCM 11219]